MKITSRLLFPIVAILLLIVIFIPFVIYAIISLEIGLAVLIPLIVVFIADFVRGFASEIEKNRQVAEWTSLLLDEIAGHMRIAGDYIDEEKPNIEEMGRKAKEVTAQSETSIKMGGKVFFYPQIEEFSRDFWEYGVKMGHFARLRGLVPAVIVTNLINYYTSLQHINAQLRLRKALFTEYPIESHLDPTLNQIRMKGIEIIENYLEENLPSLQAEAMMRCHDLCLFIRDYGISGGTLVSRPGDPSTQANLQEEENRRRHWYLTRGVEPPPTFADHGKEKHIKKGENTKR